MLVLKKHNDLFDPWRSLFGLDKNFESMFDYPSSHQDYSIKVDVTEDENSFKIVAVAPGVKKENAEIKVEDGILFLQIEHPEPELAEDSKYLRKERKHGKYFARYSLSSKIKADEITANFKNGVLTIVIPKEEKAKPVSIKIS